MTYYGLGAIFANEDALLYCEKIGIYAVHKRVGNIITYYSYFGNEGFYKVTHNVKTGAETRKHMIWRQTPKWLGNNYNYFCG